MRGPEIPPAVGQAFLEHPHRSHASRTPGCFQLLHPSQWLGLLVVAVVLVEKYHVRRMARHRAAEDHFERRDRCYIPEAVRLAQSFLGLEDLEDLEDLDVVRHLNSTLVMTDLVLWVVHILP